MPKDDEAPPILLDYQRGVRRPDEHDVLVFRVDLLGDASDAFRELPQWQWLSEEERQRAARFVRPRDGRRFVRCRAALRSIVGGLLDLAPPDVSFQVGPGGKPKLPDLDGTAPPWRFNVSHSGELALIAVSRTRELGVDIEAFRPIQQADRIVASYFTASEVREFEKLDEEGRAAAFIRGWTRKEAVVKAQGVGLAGLATEFETLFGEDKPGEEFRPCSPLSEVLGWRIWEISPSPGYVATLAVESS